MFAAGAMTKPEWFAQRARRTRRQEDWLRLYTATPPILGGLTSRETLDKCCSTFLRRLRAMEDKSGSGSIRGAKESRLPNLAAIATLPPLIWNGLEYVPLSSASLCVILNQWTLLVAPGYPW